MAITSARMQQKRGEEVNFDPDKMLPGEWAVSLDTKYVRMCFSPGLCVRMATYEAFEADMAKIQKILEECQTIEEAVTRINTEISEKANAVAEYTKQAKGYRDETKQFRDGAETSATNAKSSEDNAKVSETNAKVSETNAKISEENAQRVAETLPEDYTSLSKAFYNTAIKQKAVGDNIHVTDSADAKQVEFGLYGKATQDGEPTPDNRKEITVSGADGSVEVVSCGKNLLQNVEKSKTVNGVTFTVNEDKSVTVNGTASANATYILTYGDFFIENSGKEVILSGNFSNSNVKLQIWQGVGNAPITDTGNGEKGVVVERDEFLSQNVALSVVSGATVNNATIYPMIRLATDTDDTYEPYIETTSTIPTPDGLAGIPVESGGNYTDENGRQWICDEVVKYADGSGKRIQRIGKTVLNGSEGIAWTVSDDGTRVVAYCKPNALWDKHDVSEIYDTNILCNCLIGGLIGSEINRIYIDKNWLNMSFDTGYLTSSDELNAWLTNNNLEFWYELAEPIITDLSAEEIAEIEKLHTFYPVTNISNDADCGMSITYMADAKNYIDNRLALIESAMLNNI